jgi:CPA1 family monovalent cation:H+ antiporter
MYLTLVLVIGIISVVATSVLSERIRVAAPLGLVLVGIALSFVPGVHVHVDPELVLTGILPPLLYASATRMPGHDFRRNFSTIFALAVYLVAITTVATGYLVNALLPGVGLAAAFALGAVISPTDAVAATSVGSKLGLPSRLTTIVEGEGLVNDATALVLLASATTAINHQTHIWRVGVSFVYSVAIAVVIGLLVGGLGVLLRSMLQDAVFTTAISFVIPFVAFLPTEQAHASGVLAVVVAGLVSGVLGPRHLPAQSRQAEAINWRTIAFLLEGGIFLAMGLQLKTLWDDAGRSSYTALWVGLLVSLLTLVVRVVYLVPVVAGLRRDAERADKQAGRLEKLIQRVADGDTRRPLPERRRARFEQRVRQRRADLDFARTQRFGWRGGGVLAWAGMRGAVTVAAVQTLPEDASRRAELVLIAFTVAAATLIVQGLSLPYVIRALKVPGDDAEADRAAYLDLIGDLSAAAAEVLDGEALSTADGAPIAPELVDRVRRSLRVPAAGDAPAAAGDDEERRQYIELLAMTLAAQRSALLEARSEGHYSSRVLDRAQRVIDLQESTLRSVPQQAG